MNTSTLDSSIIVVHGIIVSNIWDFCVVNVPCILVDYDAWTGVIELECITRGWRRLRLRCTIPRGLVGWCLRFVVCLNGTGVIGRMWGWRRLRRLPRGPGGCLVFLGCFGFFPRSLGQTQAWTRFFGLFKLLSGTFNHRFWDSVFDSHFQKLGFFILRIFTDILVNRFQQHRIYVDNMPWVLLTYRPLLAGKKLCNGNWIALPLNLLLQHLVCTNIFQPCLDRGAQISFFSNMPSRIFLLEVCGFRLQS